MVFWGALIVAAIATFGAYRLLSAKSDSAKVLMRPVVLAVADIPEGAAIERFGCCGGNLAGTNRSGWRVRVG